MFRLLIFMVHLNFIGSKIGVWMVSEDIQMVFP